MTGRRLLLLLFVLAAIGIPAGVLQAVCAGRSCDTQEEGGVRASFCPLPDELKRAIVSGYREGRSPEALGVGNEVPVFREMAGSRSPWPANRTLTDTAVPIVFWGAGVRTGASVPEGLTLDRIAPSVSEILRFDRPFEEVRSGTAVEGVANGERPELVLLIAWKWTGSAELEGSGDWPFLASLLEQGAGTLEGETGSLPLDPSAMLATIGTGGLPSQHGITGSFVRNDEGVVVPAFGEGAPVTVIASLADDLEDADPRTLVGLVETDEQDRGIVGGAWYPDQDPVDVVIGDSAAAPLAVNVHLSSGYGADGVPDILGVVLDGSVRSMDGRTRRIVTAAELATSGSVLVVVAGTGSWERSRLAESDTVIVEAIEEAVPGDAQAVVAVVPGGLFLNQDVLREAQVTGQAVVEAMRSVEAANGERMLADAFQGFAVSFARYC